MENLVSFFKINCYTNLDELQKINKQSTKIKPFPLTPLFINNDTPSWEDSDSIVVVSIFSIIIKNRIFIKVACYIPFFGGGMIMDWTVWIGGIFVLFIGIYASSKNKKK